MHKRLVIMLSVLCLVLPFAVGARAHCEIPCGIYGDEMRVQEINEHIATIEKSMKNIVQLEKDDSVNMNQLVRWIMNKENHANEIQHIVSQYFMTQRIKLKTDNYNEKLSLLHQMLLLSMKCKQTTDLSHVAGLRELVEKFEKLYFHSE